MPQVSLPQQRFTAVFGKGTGGTTAPETPERGEVVSVVAKSRCHVLWRTVALPHFGNRRVNFGVSPCLLGGTEGRGKQCSFESSHHPTRGSEKEHVPAFAVCWLPWFGLLFVVRAIGIKPSVDQRSLT